jgi:hypothetical protein
MSQKNQYIKKSNNTSKNRSYVKGGQGTVFSQLNDMFKANSSANKQIEEMTTLQTTLKENLKTINKDIQTFKDNYDKLVGKVSYVDSKIKDITDVNDKCKKLHPSVVTPTENKDTENKGFFGSLFGSNTKTEKPDESDDKKDESDDKKDDSDDKKDDSDDKKDESEDDSDDKYDSEYDKDPFSGVLNEIESHPENSSHKPLTPGPSNIFDNPDSAFSDILNTFSSSEKPATPETPAIPVTPSIPETPAIPVTHETPAIPAIHETPAIPVTPAIPAIHETPAIPAIHETPAIPAIHETPATPSPPSIFANPPPPISPSIAIPSNPFDAQSSENKENSTKGGIKKRNKKSTKKRRKSRKSRR